ncbi:DUF934 domain-containing protein [Rhodospirillaceae bacterium KN72]|uniref:DUF934 domain-containing protein n=1 Tax=Pacificispira spongiicola TaxID=2729598 RepID=A0A7Y0HFP6_9PROT|nr:DUF934 domain-containing protein [Pacificispira spongiicola]NMM43509.1 DUF934 domain-containing protein [Pacificispira spongiicola]
MALIKDGKQVSDQWLTADADTPVQPDIPTIVPFARFIAERDSLLRSQAEIGVKLSPGDDVAALAGDLDRLKVIAVDFPAFTDGRAYSYARLLRQRYGYRGEIRATGNVLRDQYLFMLRAGIDAFEVTDKTQISSWIDALEEFSHYYQKASDAAQPVWAKRHTTVAAAE